LLAFDAKGSLGHSLLLKAENLQRAALLKSMVPRIVFLFYRISKKRLELLLILLVTMLNQ
jgi:hypothetical protein